MAGLLTSGPSDLRLQSKPIRDFLVTCPHGEIECPPISFMLMICEVADEDLDRSKVFDADAGDLLSRRQPIRKRGFITPVFWRLAR